MAEFPLYLHLLLLFGSWNGSLTLHFSSSKVKPMLTPKRSSRCDSGSLRNSPTDLRWWRSPSCHLISPCPESGMVPGRFTPLCCPRCHFPEQLWWGLKKVMTELLINEQLGSSLPHISPLLPIWRLQISLIYFAAQFAALVCCYSTYIIWQVIIVEVELCSSLLFLFF